MDLQITDEFTGICEEIRSMNLSIDEWRLIEADDMFQTSNFCGGFDEIENAFCFSYYDKERKEFWFQIDLEEVQQIVTGSKTSVLLHKAS